MIRHNPDGSADACFRRQNGNWVEMPLGDAIALAHAAEDEERFDQLFRIWERCQGNTVRALRIWRRRRAHEKAHAAGGQTAEGSNAGQNSGSGEEGQRGSESEKILTLPTRPYRPFG